HVIAEHVLLRNGPVRRDLTRIHVMIDCRAGFTRTGDFGAVFGAESVHVAAVVIRDKVGVVVAVVARLDEIAFCKRNVFVAARAGSQMQARTPNPRVAEARRSLHASAARSIGAGKRGEKIVERAILLNHYDDVLDIVGAAAGAPRCRRDASPGARPRAKRRRDGTARSEGKHRKHRRKDAKSLHWAAGTDASARRRDCEAAEITTKAATFARRPTNPGLTPHGVRLSAASGTATATPTAIPAPTANAVARRQRKVATTPG